MLNRNGLLAALGAYLWWGLSVFYFKQLAAVGGYEIVAHRVVQTVIILAALLTLTRRWSSFTALLTSPKTLLALAFTTVMVAVNWLLYIHAILTNQVTEASLGYYINPLVSVLLGILFLGERLSRTLLIAVAFASAGVLLLIWPLGHLPWISLTLAVTFGFYGLVRKRLNADPFAALLLETLLLVPPALFYLSQFGHAAALNTTEQALLMLAGIVTAVPLILFAIAAARLPLYVMGVMQYIAPSVGLMIGVLGYGERFGPWHWAGFGLIWVGLAIFTYGLWKPVAERPDSR